MRKNVRRPWHWRFYAGRALGAMGVEDSKGVLRLSFTHYTTKDEIDKLLNALDDLF